jgi:AcrR family transcriptional regulator
VHDKTTAAALLQAAELIVEAEGLDGLSVRRLADRAGTTTRAVYSSLGSKEALLAALGVRAFELLSEQVAAVPRSEDAAADLVAAGTSGFRRWVWEHPALFRIGFQHQVSIPHDVWSQIGVSAERAFGALHDLIRRLEHADGLGGRAVQEATLQFHAMCEGLAIVDLRAGMRHPRDDTTPRWADALAALITGWRTSRPTIRR